MATWSYPLSPPMRLRQDAVNAAIACLNSGKYTMGPMVAEFEEAVAARVGSKHAVMVNSGSSANLLAVESLMRPMSGRPRWVPGDEVLVPALSWSTTVWPIIQLGLVPVFVDADPLTLAMDWGHAERMVGPRTRGAMLIHVLGAPADITAASQFCHRHGLVLVEDCCESWGATWKGGKSVGTVGMLGTFSHFYSHQLTTMEGGTIITDDDAVADDLRSMRAHGWTRNRRDKSYSAAGHDQNFCFVTTGYNVRPLELTGAMGLRQLQSDRWECAYRQTRALVVKGLLERHMPYVSVAQPIEGHSWMNIALMVADDAPMSRDEVVKAFESAGVETRPIIAGNLLRHPVMKHLPYRAETSYPVADRVMRQGFMIGSYPPEHYGDGDPVSVAVQSLVRA